MSLRDARRIRRTCTHQPWQALRAEAWEGRKNHNHHHEHRWYTHHLLWQRERACWPFEKKLNGSSEATPRSKIEQYMGMHVLYDKQKFLLTPDARRQVFGFINHMGLDPNSDVGISTPLHPHEVYSKADLPPEIDIKLNDKVWQAHCKLMNHVIAIWARPDLVHSVAVLGRYVHTPSENLWNAYSRIAKWPHVQAWLTWSEQGTVNP